MLLHLPPKLCCSEGSPTMPAVAGGGRFHPQASVLVQVNRLLSTRGCGEELSVMWIWPLSNSRVTAGGSWGGTLQLPSVSAAASTDEQLAAEWNSRCRERATSILNPSDASPHLESFGKQCYQVKWDEQHILVHKCLGICQLSWNATGTLKSEGHWASLRSGSQLLCCT